MQFTQASNWEQATRLQSITSEKFTCNGFNNRNFEENGLRLVARPTNLILKYFGQGRVYLISKILIATMVWRKFRAEVIIFVK